MSNETELGCNCRELPHHPMCLQASRPTLDHGEDDGLVEWLRGRGRLPWAARIEQDRETIRELRIALDDAVATIAAVRATSVGTEWSESAEHFHRVCGDTLQRVAALTRKD